METDYDCIDFLVFEGQTEEYMRVPLHLHLMIRVIFDRPKSSSMLEIMMDAAARRFR